MTQKIENAIKTATIPREYDFRMEDAMSLFKLAASGDSKLICKALRTAFTFGFVMGNRATITRKLKRM